jgi:hypothetical protein
MISKSHLGKSFSTQAKKRLGKSSPKKTISGFTTPLHFSQVGTESENIRSERKLTDMLNYLKIQYFTKETGKSISTSTRDS